MPKLKTYHDGIYFRPTPTQNATLRRMAKEQEMMLSEVLRAVVKEGLKAMGEDEAREQGAA